MQLLHDAPDVDGFSILENVFAKLVFLGVGTVEEESLSYGIIRTVSSRDSSPFGIGRCGRPAMMVSLRDEPSRLNMDVSTPLIVPVDNTSSVTTRVGLAFPPLFRNVPVDGGDDGLRGGNPVGESLSRLLTDEAGDIERPSPHPCESTELDVCSET